MANQHTKAKAARAARAAAAKRAWVTIRANREKQAAASIQATVKATERKMAA